MKATITHNRFTIIKDINRLLGLEISEIAFSDTLLEAFSKEISADFSFFVRAEAIRPDGSVYSFKIQSACGLSYFDAGDFQVVRSADQFLFYDFFLNADGPDQDLGQYVFTPCKRIANFFVEHTIIAQDQIDLKNHFLLIIPLIENGKYLGFFEFFVRRALVEDDIYFTELIADYVLSHRNAHRTNRELETNRSIKERLKNFFQEDVYDDIVAQQIDLYPFKKTSIVPMFVDIRGFSMFSETNEIGYVHESINNFVDWLSGKIIKYKGTQDKYTGDGIFAFWGAPVAHEDFINRAMQCAFEICDQFIKRQREGDFPSMWGLGIGLAYGDAIVGSLGKRILQYTALGRTVNMASRLCDIAHNQIAVSDELFHAVDAPNYLFEKKHVDIRGIDRTVPVYIYHARVAAELV